MYKVANYLLEHGHDVDILCGKWWGKNSAPDHMIGVPFIRQIYHGRRSKASALSFTISLARVLSRLSKRYDIVEFNMSPVLPFSLVDPMRRLPPFRRSKIVGMLHEVWQEYWFQYAGRASGSVGYLLEHHAAKSLDSIITISDFNRRRLMRWGIEPEKIAVIRPGVDFAEIVNAKPASRKSDLIFVGRMVEDHHVERLIEMVNALKNRYGRRVAAILVGGGPELPALRRLAQTLGLSGEVSFTGPLEDRGEVYSLLKASKVYVFPSSPHGGWNISCVEANSAGLPIITCTASEIGRAAELVTEGVNGYATGASADKFAELGNFLLGDEQRRRAMAAASVAHAAKYDWPTACNQTLTFYDKLLES